MIVKSKEHFREILSSRYLPIYLQDWYLDIVCGKGNWDVFIKKSGNTPLAVWVIMAKKKWGISYGVMPAMGMYQGLFPLSEHLDFKHIEEIILTLKKQYHFILQDIPLSKIAYFESTDLFKSTYIIDGNLSIDEAYENLKPKCRRSIKKASENHIHTDKITPSEAVAFFKNAFKEKNITNPFPHPTFRQLIEACKERNQTFTLGAKDKDGALKAAGVFFYDKKWVYNIGGAQIGKERGMYLILWEAIKRALDSRKSFDFEGSMIPGVAKFFEGFGGEKIDYPVFRYSKNRLISALADYKFKL